jgi:hypothetical protein
MTLVLRNTDLDISGVTFAAPKPSGHGGQTIYVNYKKDGHLHKSCQIQTPWLSNPFGLNTSPIQEGEQPKYYVELSFGNAPSDYVEDFHNKMNELDKHVCDSAIENQAQWLGKTDIDDDYRDEFLSENYKHIVRVYRNRDKEATGEYPDTIRFKVPHYINKDEETGEESESFGDMEVYDADKNLIPIETVDDLKNALGRGNRVRVIVQCHSVWQSGDDFGVSWRVKRIQMIGHDNNMGNECAFIGGSEEGEGGNSDEESFN